MTLTTALTYRSIKLVSGSSELQLTPTTFNPILAEGTWDDRGSELSFTILVRETTWNRVEALANQIRQYIGRAVTYAQSLSGLPVSVYTKTSDNLTYLAEFGPTWRKKRILTGMVSLSKHMASPSGVSAWFKISLSVEDYWRRAAPMPMFEVATTGADVTSLGGISIPANANIFTQKLSWTTTTGVTFRYHWVFPSTAFDYQVAFARVGGSTFRLYYGPSPKAFYFTDEAATRFGTGSYAFSPGQIVEVTLSLGPAGVTLYVDGSLAGSWFGTLSWPSVPSRYRFFSTDPGSGPVQSVVNLQAWPTQLTDAEMVALSQWGRPEQELPLVVTPTDGATPTPVENTSSKYSFFNVPGSVPALLRPIVQGFTADYDRIVLGMKSPGVPRPSATQPVVKYECESGTLGANTASTADASASAGNVARFTPANTSWAVRTTLNLAADASGVDRLKGQWRVMLAVKDNATLVQINSVRWRLKVAGQAIGDYSEVMSAPSYGTRCLVDLGELSIPPSSWPEGSLTSTGVEYSGDYLILELEAQNSIGSGGGTLDLDAIYLFPTDVEAEVNVTTWTVSTQMVLLDFTSDPPAPSIIFDTWRTFEWAGVAEWFGDVLEVSPSLNQDDGSLICIQVQRDTSGQTNPKDTSWTLFQIMPRWNF